ncbi:keratin-associated protein 24-1 [Ursus americanus]|uniref:Keratin-associated protein n=2 Tax=Ursus TaxID=9639 RepID=A0A384CZE4_URSMA|nr:keratin-associated protein 24-1 [Ursus maritimus]XP_026356639.1 keratin-associated protein 24-1 [Ursus arctos]XP_045641674.1 keratin-associated protein 24-1 [Ursus americanus]
MQSSSVSLLDCSGDCSGTSYRTHCYIPVTSSVALCSSDVSPTFGLCLPSSYQGNLWLLGNCQGTYGETPSCKSPSCELKTCTTSCNPSSSCVPCNSPTVSQVCSTCETTNIGPKPSCSPCTQTKGYVSYCYTPSQRASKVCQTFSSGFKCFGRLNCLSDSFRPLNHCRLGSLKYRAYQNLAFIPSGFSPSCCIARSCQSQNYLVRNCQYPSYGSMSCQPLGYFSRNFQSLSCIPSTFPPLRYLCSGCRPLSCC